MLIYAILLIKNKTHKIYSHTKLFFLRSSAFKAILLLWRLLWKSINSYQAYTLSSILLP